MQRKQKVDVDKLANWKLVDEFRSRVLPHLQARPLTASEKDPRRTLQSLDYLSAFLLAMFNPVFTSLRALAHASHCDRMRRVTEKPFSIASFSEAQHPFDAEILAAVLRELAAELKSQRWGGDLDNQAREALKSLVAVDGSVFRALDRMAWAEGSSPGPGVRLHLQFEVLDQLPKDWAVTADNVFEGKVFAERIQPGALYAADRLYGGDYTLLGRMQEMGAHFVVRAKSNWPSRDRQQPGRKRHPPHSGRQEELAVHG